MAEKEFKNVWYLSRELTWDDMSFFPYKRSATIRIKGGCIEVICGDELVKIYDINQVSMGKQGRDFVNDWVRIDYGDEKTAYFADGSALGWGGIFGGTSRIFNAIKESINPEAKKEAEMPIARTGEMVSSGKDGAQSEQKVNSRRIQKKYKATAIWLSIFFGFWAWIYTWEKDQWKFWTGLGVTAGTLGFAYIAFYVWAIVETASRTEEFYSNY